MANFEPNSIEAALVATQGLHLVGPSIAPEFTDDAWGDRDWEARTHKHYGAPVYWGTGVV